MKQEKRILKIELQRMDDSSPDTSWLGEYSDRAQGDYSIDRKHSLDCPVNNPIRPAIDQLERAIAYLDKERLAQTESCSSEPNGRYMSGIWADSYGEAQYLLIEAQNELAECDCNRSWDRREYRYFNPGSIETFNPVASWIPADTADRQAYWRQAMRENTARDFDRMESLNAGNWGFIGIRAQANIVLGETCQTIHSGGLCGIESDSGESYLQEIEKDELSDLRRVLCELGFSKRAIAAAVKEM